MAPSVGLDANKQNCFCESNQKKERFSLLKIQLRQTFRFLKFKINKNFLTKILREG